MDDDDDTALLVAFEALGKAASLFRTSSVDATTTFLAYAEEIAEGMNISMNLEVLNNLARNAFVCLSPVVCLMCMIMYIKCYLGSHYWRNSSHRNFERLHKHFHSSTC